ncbi:MAG: ABC transporter ATP-binding protein [Thermaerobacter sp.]|nr:ABC transporter ATP-binding protein [Thermaerobacter sp.]
MQRNTPFGSYRDLLSRYLSPRLAPAALMGCCLLAATGLQLATPAIAGAFIDSASSGLPESGLIRLALLFLGTALFGQVANLLATLLSERIAWQATNELRIDLTRHLLSLDQTFHAHHLPGELIERVDGDVSALSTLLSAAAVDLFGSALLLCGLVVALWLVHATLGFVFGGFVILTAATLEAIRRRAVPLQTRSRAGSASYFGFVGEALDAAEDVRANAASTYVMARVRAHLASWMPFYVRAEVSGYAVWVAALVAFGIGDGLAYAFGAHLYLTHALSLGSVYTIVAYAALVAQPLGTLRQRLVELQGADAGIVRIQALFRERSTLEQGTAHIPHGPLAISFADVRFAYPNGQCSEAQSDRSALRCISFHVAAGRRLGVIGTTGAGKSTIARLVMRLYDPQEGSVQLAGIDLRSLRLAELRAKIGYATQEVQIFRASLRDNLTLFDPAARDDDLLARLEALGLGQWLARQPDGLSTQISSAALSAGEAQLISLLRVYHKDPPVVLLDEISSRLDPATEAALDRALEYLLKDRTAIVIAHRPWTLEHMDDILVLAKGQVVEFGERSVLAMNPQTHFSRFRRTAFREVRG